MFVWTEAPFAIVVPTAPVVWIPPPFADASLSVTVARSRRRRVVVFVSDPVMEMPPPNVAWFAWMRASSVTRTVTPGSAWMPPPSASVVLSVMTVLPRMTRRAGDGGLPRPPSTADAKIPPPCPSLRVAFRVMRMSMSVTVELSM